MSNDFHWDQRKLDELAGYNVNVVQLIADHERLKRENAALREVVEAVALLHVRESYETPYGTRDVVLHDDDLNVVWIRDKARELLKFDA